MLAYNWYDRPLIGVARVDPIPFSVKNDVTGLGKRAQDERMIETTVSQRRGLDSERQIRETVEQRQSREVYIPYPVLFMSTRLTITSTKAKSS